MGAVLEGEGGERLVAPGVVELHRPGLRNRLAISQSKTQSVNVAQHDLRGLGVRGMARDRSTFQRLL